MARPNSRAGRVLQGGPPCTATNLPINSGLGLSPSYPTAPITVRWGTPFNDHRPLVNGILWILHTGTPWRDLPSATAPGKLSRIASTARATTAPWSVSSPRCRMNWTTRASSTTTCGASTAPSSAPAAPLPGRKKKARRPRRLLAGVRRRKCRSRLTMRWGVHGAVSAPRSTSSATVTGSSSRSTSPRGKGTKVRRSSRRWLGACSTAATGQRRWPRRLAGDKGYSYRRIRRWCPPPPGRGGHPDAEGPASG